ncbi:MAG TPA: hypothetical protein VFY75_10770 [Solirubrobacterales bacterium]|nr:hypothetical protein [Solirubrobacterales bacterium]
MVVMAPEKNRTDERLDALANRTDEGFRELRAELKTEMGALRAETGALRDGMVEVQKEIGEVREGLGEVKAEIKGMNRTLQVGFGLIGAVLTGILGLIAALLTIQL